MSSPFLSNTIYLYSKEAPQVRSVTKATSTVRLQSSLEISATELAKRVSLLPASESGCGTENTTAGCLGSLRGTHLKGGHSLRECCCDDSTGWDNIPILPVSELAAEVSVESELLGGGILTGEEKMGQSGWEGRCLGQRV